MVLGMNSGRSGDGHRTNTHQGRREKTRDREQIKPDPPSQTHTIPQQLHKLKPSAEQVHIARMLTDDKTPEDMLQRVLQVQAVVEDRPEESIVIALQENEFDVSRACDALLDSNGGTKEEWMTMSAPKKKNKKQTDQHRRGGGGGSRGTSRAAAQHTRQNYGGSVTVTTEDSDKDKRPSRGGGRGQGGPRGRSTRQRDRNEGGRKRTEGRGGGGNSFEGRFPPRHRQKPSEESWDTKDDSTVTPVTTVINDIPAVDKTSDDSWNVHNTDPSPASPPPPPSEEWVIVETPPPSFPDALGRHPYNTPSVVSPSNEISFGQLDKSKVVKSRRYKASQIPDQPVEMPCGINNLQYDMSVLGIDFGIDATPLTPPTDTPTTVEVGVSSPQVVDTDSITFEQSRNQGNSTLLPASPFTDIADDSIISSYVEKPPENLEPPPGLVHPSQQSSDKPTPTPQPSLLPPPPDPISLPPLTSPPSTTQATPSSGLLSSSIASEGLSHPNDVSAALPSTTSYSMGLHSTGNSSYAVPNPSVTAPTTQQQQTLFPSHSAAIVPSSSSAQPLSSALSSSNGVPPVPSRVQNTPITGHQVPQHQQQIPGKVQHSSSGNVHPMAAATGMVYPHMLPQFPSPYGTTPVMMPPYTYDVETMNRYPGFFGQHPTNQDQGGGVSLAGGLGRDPQPGGGAGGTLSFGGDTKYDTSASNQSQTQQQQQAQQGGLQQAQLNAYYSHYPNLLYHHMYAPPHMGMAAATGYSAQQLGHKPTAAATYPVGTSYQPNPQYPGGYEDEYAKMMVSLNKSSQAPSTTSADFAYSKHQFDSKGNIHNSFLPLGTPMGGYMMGHHHVPPAPIMTHDASSRSKSHKYATPTWSGPSTHT